MFAGINIFWARLRLILARAVITINITLEGIKKIKTEKMTTKHTLKNIFFTSAVRNVNKL